MESRRIKSLEVGEHLFVHIEKVAHGGHFIARHEGQVIFVRHAISGEHVEIVVTSAGSNLFRADVVSVLEASPDRVVPPCAFAHAQGCGGCDFQHVSPARQRRLKEDVIVEQFARIAKKDVTVEVREVGLPTRWRTRIASATDNQGHIGFYASRSHNVIAVDDCLIAAESVDYSGLASRKWPANSRVEISASSQGERSIAIAPAGRGSKARLTEGPAALTEEVEGHELRVSQSSFWQSHELAPEVLTNAVNPYFESGDVVLDLYGGVGLFTAAAIDIVGPEGFVQLIESSVPATRDASENFAKFDNVQIVVGDVDREIHKIAKADVVVLDPPREGAGKSVLAKIASLKPRTLVYVACDPAALARDTAFLEANGWQMADLKAFDLFPMTHHIECVAVFKPSQNAANKVS